MHSKELVELFFRDLQDDICTQLEAIDGKGNFSEDLWQRPGGGGGRARVINGAIIEKGGVNFSAVYGILPDKIKSKLNLGDGDFYATGVSIVLHPISPMVPIIHMNVRYFEMSDGTWWFGGGIDLTPHYISQNLSKDFHLGLKKVCDFHDLEYYPEFKKWADDYFYLPHRKETRGIGGIFFDRLNKSNTHDFQSRFAFVKDVGKAFIPLYHHQVEQGKNLDYSESEKIWQMLRRGRYVEFNLVWDKGTKFGLHTNGRTESILMSLPPIANWKYNHKVLPDSKEANTLNLLRKKINWINPQNEMKSYMS